MPEPGPEPSPAATAALAALERAIVATVAYADVFDFPLSMAEIQRYLIGQAASAADIDDALTNSPLIPNFLDKLQGYYTLAGRKELVDLRRQRQDRAQALWAEALFHGRRISRLPFVRMVAVTGSLAVDNADEAADVDLMIVTAPGRLWLCRALIIAVVRLAAARGVSLCPNYIVALNALELTEQNLYAARELTQMIPLAGLLTYERLRLANSWTGRFLPNADGPPRTLADPRERMGRVQRGLEAVLSWPPFGWLERWEMRRKIQRLNRAGQDHGEAAYASGWCKGHVDQHQQRALEAFQQRLEAQALTGP